ncbi:MULTISPECIES: thiamine-phosphate kinase [Phenylobacterium]|uniref:Thiamine-monophosphate kinase n=1 Tax=Phenylobacterium koreense TaxID=266125 RepID=A0ABV2EK47_9CAUL
MSGADQAPDEFGQIERLFRPLTRGAPEAFDLLDDAAAIPGRPGHDLIVTKDAMVEGVHFLPSDPPDLVARKLLRVNLSDLAAKGAEPYGYFLATAWPRTFGWEARKQFASGLAVDGERFGLVLLGGDTVSTPGPLSLSLTMLGWAPTGRMVRRSGARPGDLLMVSGTIGDGLLGLKAAHGDVSDPDGYLAGRYRVPNPRLDLREFLRATATAAADVSDGLIADAGHIAKASGVRARIELERVPLSAAARAWAAAQADLFEALSELAAGGDDYEVVCTAPRPLEGFTVIGAIEQGEGVELSWRGETRRPAKSGWKHG